MIVCNIFLVVRTSDLTDKVIQLEAMSGLNIYDNEYIPSGIDMGSKAEEKQMISRLLADVNTLRRGNYYIPMYEGNAEEPISILIYNKDNECVMQDNAGGQTIYLTDGNMVYFGEDVIYGSDCSLVDQVAHAIEVCQEGNAEIKYAGEIDVSVGSGKAEQYIIDTHGWENIQKIYAKHDAVYGAEMVTSMKENLANSIEADYLAFPHYRYCFTLVDDELVAISNYMYFGEEAIGSWNECYSNWGIEGWFEVYDWDIPEWWYTYDFANIGETDGSEALEQAVALVEGIQTMLAKFDSDNSTDVGIDPNQSEKPVDDNTNVDIEFGEPIENEPETPNEETDEHEGHNHD